MEWTISWSCAPNPELLTDRQSTDPPNDKRNWPPLLNVLVDSGKFCPSRRKTVKFLRNSSSGSNQSLHKSRIVRAITKTGIISRCHPLPKNTVSSGVQSATHSFWQRYCCRQYFLQSPVRAVIPSRPRTTLVLKPVKPEL